jgi:hypothetical protein
MKKLFVLTLLFVSKISFASFPVAEKTPFLGLDPFRLFLLGLNVAIFVYNVMKNKKEYGTWYKPWSTFSETDKIKSYIGFGLLAVLIIIFLVAFNNLDGFWANLLLEISY